MNIKNAIKEMKAILRDIFEVLSVIMNISPSRQVIQLNLKCGHGEE